MASNLSADTTRISFNAAVDGFAWVLFKQHWFYYKVTRCFMNCPPRCLCEEKKYLYRSNLYSFAMRYTKTVKTSRVTENALKNEADYVD